jgi:hypothetical protein
MYVKIIVLLGLIKLLDATESPLLCAGLYAIVAAIFAGLTATDASRVILAGLVGFILSYIYFWLLKKTRFSWLWWIIAIGGMFIGLV